MTQQLDLSGQEIKVGDWIVQAVSFGRCAGIKFAKVVGFAKSSGALRCCSYEFLERRWVRNPGERSGQWVDGPCWDRTGPYTVSYSDRVFVTDESRVDPKLVEYINVDLKGDPLYDPEKNEL